MNLFESLAGEFSVFNVFRYLTLRSICGVLTALIICFVLGPVMIRKLQFYQIGQTVRDDGPPTHFSKVGTPTMGGILILVAVVLSTLLWADLNNRFITLDKHITNDSTGKSTESTLEIELHKTENGLKIINYKTFHQVYDIE